MAVTVRKATLWRKEVENTPGMLASVLEPLAAAGADLTVVMGYRYPGAENRAAIEVHPVAGKRMAAAAEQAGLAPVAMPTLMVEGDNRPGLGHAIAAGISEAQVNIVFVVAQVIGRRYSAVFGFESDADAVKAAAVIKKAGGAPAARKSRGGRR